jgi:hypothetical protein
VHAYRFAGTKGQRLFIDGFGSVSTTPRASTCTARPVSVTGNFTYGDTGPFVLTEDGEHHIVVQAAALAQGFEYGFRILDLADAEPLAFDTEASGVLDPGQETACSRSRARGAAGVSRHAARQHVRQCVAFAGSTRVSGGPEIETVLPTDGLTISWSPAARRTRQTTDSVGHPETATLR